MTSIASRFARSQATERRLRQLAITWLLLLGASVFGAAATNSESYQIQPTDVLVVEVVNEPQIGVKELRVTASGEISYPFIGAVRVLNLSPAEVQAKIKELLEADYLVNAQVLVQVKEFRKRFVSVIGQVTRAGPVEIPPERRLTVIEAIGFAGGTTRLARTSDIQLTRAGRTEPMRLSLDEMMRNPDKPVYVEAGDVINVPESRI